jgi:metal-responsive CopG/Arc/MetJ family transcriptional regulator
MPKVSVSISIDTSLLYEIEQLAQKEKKTRTQKITEILTDYIKKTK